MTECFRNNLPEEAHCEEQSPEIADQDVIEMLRITGQEFSKCQEPKNIQAKKFALEKLGEFKDRLVKYEKPTEEFDILLNTIETIFKEKVTQKEIIDAVVRTDEKYHIQLEDFVPREYTTGNTEKSKSFHKDMDIALVLQEKKTKMNEYITGERPRIPSFYNDDFNGLQDVITKALQKPGTILSKYESFTTDENLSKNPKFLATLNAILASEYPELFGKDQQMTLYEEKLGCDIKQITILLDIMKYSPELKGHFIDMMSAASRHDQVTMLALYNTHFVRTEIGRQIYTTFKESSFIDCLQGNVIETMIKHIYKQTTNKSDIYKILAKDDKKEQFAIEGFSYIPQEHLNTFLSKLPEIEAFCVNNDTEGLIRYLEGFNDIDTVYKRIFVEVLKNTQDGSKKDPNASTFYANIVDHYYKELDVSTEVNTITGHVSENKKERRNFKIIEDQFPDKTPENREEKNKELSRILNIFVVDGKINVDEARFVELQDIFKGSPLEERLKGKNGGQEMLKIIAEAARQAKENTVTDILIIDPSFKEDTINHLFKNKPKEYEELQKFLLGNENIDAKINALKRFGITTKQFGEGDDKEGYIKLVQQYFKSEITIQTTQSILNDTGAGGKLEIFEAYYQDGKKNPSELNSKLAERDKEINQQKEKQGGKEIPEIPVKSYDSLSSLGAGFSNIPNNHFITYKIDNNDVFIRKDSKNEISIFAEGIPIRGIKINDEKNPETDIQKAMDSVHFLRNSGMGVFGTNLPKMIEIINDKLVTKGKDKIDFTNGLTPDGSEERIFLQYISALIKEPTLSIGNIQENFRTISTQSGGFLTKLQTIPGYVTNNSLNMTTILGDLIKVQI